MASGKKRTLNIQGIDYIDRMILNFFGHLENYLIDLLNLVPNMDLCRRS